jgi:septal ring factor EnvC (AmiA/AmiB activator)
MKAEMEAASKVSAEKISALEKACEELEEKNAGLVSTLESTKEELSKVEASLAETVSKVCTFLVSFTDTVKIYLLH